MLRSVVASALVASAYSASVKIAAPEVHPDRQAEIDIVNAHGNATWRAAPQTRFAHLAPGASKPLCGVLGDWKADVESKVAAGEAVQFVPKDPTAPIPDDFDAATNWPMCEKIINDIRDQSNCGCCWAFGGAEAASDRMCVATKGKVIMPISAEDVCFCASMDGCNGGQITTPWQHIAKGGGIFGKGGGAVSGGQYQGSGPFGKQCSDFTLPHCHHHGPVGKDPYPAENAPGCPHASSPKCPRECEASFSGSFDDDKYAYSGRFQSASGEEQIQRMIMEGGSVETAFTVYSDFENYAGGIYKHTAGTMAGGHAVKFTGWGVDNGVKYWKVANSWNPYWGEQGFFRIARGNNECGIEDQVTGSPSDAVWTHGKNALN